MMILVIFLQTHFPIQLASKGIAWACFYFYLINYRHRNAFSSCDDSANVFPKCTNFHMAFLCMLYWYIFKFRKLCLFKFIVKWKNSRYYHFPILWCLWLWDVSNYLQIGLSGCLLQKQMIILSIYDTTKWNILRTDFLE